MHMHVSIRVSACDARPPDRPQRRFLILAGVVFAHRHLASDAERARDDRVAAGEIRMEIRFDPPDGDPSVA